MEEIMGKFFKNHATLVESAHGTFTCPQGKMCPHEECKKLYTLWDALSLPKKRPPRHTKVDKSSFKGRPCPPTKYSTWYAPRLITVLNKSHFSRRQEIFFALLAENDFDAERILKNPHLKSVIKFFPTWNLVRAVDRDRYEYTDKSCQFKVVLPAKIPHKVRDKWKLITESPFVRFVQRNIDTQGNSRRPSPPQTPVPESEDEERVNIFEIDFDDLVQALEYLPTFVDGYACPHGVRMLTPWEENYTMHKYQALTYMFEHNMFVAIEEDPKYVRVEPYYNAEHIPQGVEYKIIKLHTQCLHDYLSRWVSLGIDDEDGIPPKISCQDCASKLKKIKRFYWEIFWNDIIDYTILHDLGDIETQAFASSAWTKVKNTTSNLAQKIKNIPNSAAQYMGNAIVESITREAAAVAKNMYKTIKDSIKEFASKAADFLKNINWADTLFKTTLVMFNLIACFVCGPDTRMVALINLFALLGREVVKVLWPVLRKIPSFFRSDDMLDEVDIANSIFDEVRLDLENNTGPVDLLNTIDDEFAAENDIEIETQGITEAMMQIKQKVAAFVASICALAQGMNLNVAAIARKIVTFERCVTSVSKLYEFAANCKEVLLDFVFEKWHGYPRTINGSDSVQMWSRLCQKWITLAFENDGQYMAQTAVMNNYLYSYGLMLLDQMKNKQIQSKITWWLKLLEQYKGMSTDDTLLRERTRPGAFCILIHGGAGTGKSFFSTKLSKFLVSKYLFQDDPTPHIYKRNVGQVYWDSYRNQLICLYDDFFQMVDTKANPNEEIFEVIKTVNFTPFPLHSASLEEKGRLYFNSPFVLLNSNVSPDAMDAQSINCPAALKRRFHIVFRMEKKKYDGVEVPVIVPEFDINDIIALKSVQTPIRLDDEIAMRQLFHEICMSFEQYYLRELEIISRQLRGPNGKQIAEFASKIAKDNTTPLRPVDDLVLSEYRKNALRVASEFIELYRHADQLQAALEDDYKKLPSRTDLEKEMKERVAKSINHFKVQASRFSQRFKRAEEEEITTQGVSDTLLSWKEWVVRTMNLQYVSVDFKRVLADVKQAYVTEMANHEDDEEPRHGINWRNRVPYYRTVVGNDLPQIYIKEVNNAEHEDVCQAYEYVQAFFDLNAECTETNHLCKFNAHDLDLKDLVYFMMCICSTGYACYFCNGSKLGIKFKEDNMSDYRIPHFMAELKAARSNLRLKDETGKKIATLKDVAWGYIKAGCAFGFKLLVFIVSTIIMTLISFLLATSLMNLFYKRNMETQSGDATAKAKTPVRIVPTHQVSRVQQINNHGITHTTQGGVNPYKEAKAKFDAAVDERFNYPAADHNLFDQANNVQRQVVQICAERDGRIELLLHGLLITDHLLLAPSHLHEVLDDEDLVVLRLIGNSTVTFKYNEVVKRVLVDREGKDHDAMLIMLPYQLPGIRNLVSKFCKAESLINNIQPNCVLVSTTWCDQLVVPQLHFGNDLMLHEKEVSHKMRYARRDQGPHVYVLPKYWSYTMNTANAFCGSVLMAHNPRLAAKIIGIHVGANTRRQYAVADVVTYEMLTEAIEELKEYLVQTQCDEYPDINSEFVTPEFVSEEVIGFGTVIEGQFIKDERFIPGTRAFGEIPGKVTTQPKNELEPTQLYEWTGKPPPRVPAILEPTIINGELVDPLQKAAVKVAQPDVYISPEIIDRAVDDYNSVLVSCPPPGTIAKLTVDEAVFGIDDDEYINSFNVQSSAGIPLKWECKRPGKKDFVDLENKVLRSDIRAEIEALEYRLRNGIIDIQVCEDILKMEKRPLEKVLLGKTRLFSTCPFVFNVVCKMYFGRFISWFMKNRIKNESAIGINPHSIEWGYLYRYVDKYPNVLAGDFGNYDGSIRQRISRAARRVILKWFRRYRNLFPGDDFEFETEQKVRWRILAVLISSAHFINGVVIFWPASNPSGQLLTAIFNTIVNCLVCRISFFLVAEDKGVVVSFSANVRMIAFGDDNILSFSDFCLSWFTPEAFAQAFKKMGMEYTDETKSGLPEFKSLDNVKFLKRSFVHELGHVFAPLDLEVILEIPCWKRKKTGLEEFCIGLRAFTVELAHHPRPVYDFWYNKFLSALANTKYRCPAHLNYVEQRKVFRGLCPDPFYMVSSTPVVPGEE